MNPRILAHDSAHRNTSFSHSSPSEEGLSRDSTDDESGRNAPAWPGQGARSLCGGDALLLVATDRISAFDHVLATGIPGKGKILTQISLFWFDLLKDLVPNHLITAEVSEFPASLQPYADQLEGRSMLVKRASMFPVECVARGYLTGSGWKEYQASRTVCGIPLPAGLLDGSRLPEPLYTPSTKGEAGTRTTRTSLCRHRDGCGRGRCRGAAAADAGHLQKPPSTPSRAA
jgi:phosphoribosylaminoimidazole-succinocarboxamide synthase